MDGAIYHHFIDEETEAYERCTLTQIQSAKAKMGMIYAPQIKVNPRRLLASCQVLCLAF